MIIVSIYNISISVSYPSHCCLTPSHHTLSGAAYVKSTAAAEAEKADDDFDVLNESVDVVEGTKYTTLRPPNVPL